MTAVHPYRVGGSMTSRHELPQRMTSSDMASVHLASQSHTQHRVSPHGSSNVTKMPQLIPHHVLNRMRELQSIREMHINAANMRHRREIDNVSPHDSVCSSGSAGSYHSPSPRDVDSPSPPTPASANKLYNLLKNPVATYNVEDSWSCEQSVNLKRKDIEDSNEPVDLSTPLKKFRTQSPSMQAPRLSQESFPYPSIPFSETSQFQQSYAQQQNSKSSYDNHHYYDHNAPTRSHHQSDYYMTAEQTRVHDMLARSYSGDSHVPSPSSYSHRWSPPVALSPRRSPPVSSPTSTGFNAPAPVHYDYKPMAQAQAEERQSPKSSPGPYSRSASPDSSTESASSGSLLHSLLSGGGLQVQCTDEQNNITESAMSNKQTCVCLAKKNLFPVTAKISNWAVKILDFAKSVPEFTALNTENQFQLIKSSWLRILLLHMAETSFEFAVTPVGNHTSFQTAADQQQNAVATVKDVEVIERFITKCDALRLETAECEIIKKILLFSPENSNLAQKSPEIEQAKTAACASLLLHSQSTMTTGSMQRYSRLLLLLPLLYSVNTSAMETLFCKNISRDSQMDSLLKDMFA